MTRGKSTKPEHHYTCSFCGKSDAETEKLVVGTIASICRECVPLVADVANVPHFVGVTAAPIPLSDCPIGLFINGYGNLCLKSEYRTEKGAIEAYIVDSGEFFWGEATQTVENQLREPVTPVAVRGIANAP